MPLYTQQKVKCLLLQPHYSTLFHRGIIKVVSCQIAFKDAVSLAKSFLRCGRKTGVLEQHTVRLLVVPAPKFQSVWRKPSQKNSRFNTHLTGYARVTFKCCPFDLVIPLLKESLYMIFTTYPGVTYIYIVMQSFVLMRIEPLRRLNRVLLGQMIWYPSLQFTIVTSFPVMSCAYINSCSAAYTLLEAEVPVELARLITMMWTLPCVWLQQHKSFKYYVDGLPELSHYGITLLCTSYSEMDWA